MGAWAGQYAREVEAEHGALFGEGSKCQGMGIVRPEQAKLQEPLGAFGKRVVGVALLLCQVADALVAHRA